MLLMYAATVTHRHWLWLVKFSLEGTVASEVGTLDLSHGRIARSRMGVRSGDLGGQGIVLARPIQSFCTGDAILL
jgi:hypothetical protein